MDGVELDGVQDRLDFDWRVGGGSWREICQVRNAQEKFQHASVKKGLGFLVCGGLREGRGCGFAIEASENFFEHVEVGGAYGVFAALGPVGDVIFPLDFKRRGACYVNGRD